MRNAVEEVLSSSFDVVAAVADGRQAVEAVHRLDPDVVVLDISMPVLDGFSAGRELARLGSRAKLLFLSVHDGDKYVAAAIDAGAHGYVAKPRMAIDLEDAITHVLQGRLRLPTSSSLLGLTDPRARHAVLASENDDSRLQDLHEFAGRALNRGDSVVAIARSALLDSLTSRLADEGFDLAALDDQGRYQTLDVEQYLPVVMRGDELDEAALVEFIRTLEGAHAASTKDAPNNLVVLGEGAPLLLEGGNVRAAMTLERVWHSHSGAFQTLCSYRGADLETRAPETIDQVYAAHQTVSV
jgi:DNA-binding NarL/FixJ family response regulator